MNHDLMIIINPIVRFMFSCLLLLIWHSACFLIYIYIERENKIYYNMYYIKQTLRFWKLFENRASHSRSMLPIVSIHTDKHMYYTCCYRTHPFLFVNMQPDFRPIFKSEIT